MNFAVRIATAAFTVLALGVVTQVGAAEDGTGAAEKACKKAVKKRVGGDVKVHVVSSEFSQANSTVLMDVKGKRWRCLSSNDGVVAELTQQQGGQEGGRQPAANVGTEWDRGCSDAKGGSYDRSKHSDAYEEGWQACKAQGQPAGTNVGKDWDRGCSDAKNGSYDRSKHSDAYEEGWQACKKK